MSQGKVKDIELKGRADSVDQLCWDPSMLIWLQLPLETRVRLWDARSKSFLFQVSIFQVQRLEFDVISIWVLQVENVRS